MIKIITSSAEEWKVYKEEILAELKAQGANMTPLSKVEQNRLRAKMKRQASHPWKGFESIIIKGGKPFSAVELIRKDRGYL